MGRDGLSVVEKVAIIIERFLDARAASLTFNEILAGTTLTRATTHRLLVDMTGRGLLSQDELGEEYRLGPLLVSAGVLAQQAGGWRDRALPRMEVLRDQFQETIVLAELRSGAAVPVHRLDGLHEMRMNQELGRPYPAYAGATGKVLLAHLNREALTNYLANTHLEQLTDATIADAEKLRLAVEQIRRAGVAVSRGERVPDAIAVSAPIFDGQNRAVGALTVSGVASRWDRARMFIAGQAVKQAAEAISREVGYHLSPDAPTAEQLSDPDSEPYLLLSQMCDRAGEVISVGR